MPTNYTDVFGRLVEVANTGAALRLPGVIETTDWPWCSITGRGKVYTHRLAVPDIRRSRNVEATVTVSVMIVGGEVLFMQNSMVWTTSDRERHESHARHAFTAEQYAKLIRFVAENSPPDDPMLPELPENDAHLLQVIEANLEDAIDVMEKAGRFHTYWLQRRPGDVFSDYRGRAFMRHDDRHHQYHQGVIELLAEADTSVTAMLRPVDIAFAHPRDLQQVLDWVLTQAA